MVLRYESPQLHRDLREQKKTHTLTRVWRGRADGLRGMGNKSKENIIVKITPQGADQRWKTAFNFQCEGERTWEKEGVSVFHLTSIITVTQLCDAQEEKGAEMRTGCKKTLKNQKTNTAFLNRAQDIWTKRKLESQNKVQRHLKW